MTRHRSASSRRTLPETVPADTPTLSPRSANILLVLIVVLFIGLACAYASVTPAATADQHNPDENAHMLYVASVASGHLPVFRAGGADYEAHQPPLYYIICAPVYAITRSAGLSAATRAVRGETILLGVALVIVVFLSMRALFPLQPWVAVGTASFVAFLPMNVALSASVSNDMLTNLIIALVLWRLILLATAAAVLPSSRAIWREGLILGILLGIGIWTKTSALLLVPTIAFACYLLARQGLISPQSAGRTTVISLGVGGLIGAPWLLRNQILYGDPLAQHLFESAFRNTAQASDLIRYVFGGSIGAYLWGVARWTFASFWGVFDSMRLFWGQDPHGHPPSPTQPLPLVYNVIGWYCLAALAGLVVLSRRAPAGTPVQKVVLSTFAVFVGLTWLAHLRFILVFFQAQGRYWFPALLPLALFFVLGLRGLALRPVIFPCLILLTSVLLLGLNVYTLNSLLLARFLH